MIRFNAVGETRHGLMVWHRLDAYVGRSLDLYGEFSPEEAALLALLVGPGSIVIEGGANIGALTLPIARRLGEYGQLIAIEPQRLTFQALCANLALNNITNTRTLHAALGRAPSTVKIPQIDLTQPQNVGSFPAEGHPDGDAIPLLRIDDLNVPACTLIKLDVEGMERAALAGAKRTLRMHQPILYVENDKAAQRDALIQDIKGFGYRVFWHKPLLFSPYNFRGERLNVFPNVGSLNLLCLPPNDHREFPDFGLEAA